MRKWAKRLLHLLLGCVGLAMVAVLGAYGYLSSPPGNARLRGLLLQNVNRAIQGRASLEGLRLVGTTVHLRGLSLRDSHGQPVITVDRVVAKVNPLALLRREVQLQSLELQHPFLTLTWADDGLKVARPSAPGENVTAPSAIARRQPGGPSQNTAASQVAREALRPPTERSPFGLRIDRLEVEGGALTLYRPRPGRISAYRAVKLGATGALSYHPAAKSLTATVALTGQMAAPLAGPLRLELGSSVRGREDVLALSLFVAGGEVRVRAVAVGADRRLELDRLLLPPALARELFPGVPLSAPLLAVGSVLQHGQALEVALTARSGSAPLALAGTVGLSSPHAVALRGSLPGARFELAGTVSKRRVALGLRAEAAELAQLSAALGPLLPGPPVRGSGTLRLGLVGPPRAPRVWLSGHFETLERGPLAASGLELWVHLGALRPPRSLQGLFSAEAASWGGRRVRRLRGQVALGPEGLRAQNEGGRFGLLAQASALGHRRYRLSALRLRLPRQQWTLRGPARLSLGERLAVRRLRLGSGPQRVALDGRLAGGAVEAELRLHRVSLQRLPPGMLPPRLRLAGSLSGRLVARGRVDAPAVTASLSVRGGRVNGRGPMRAQLGLRSRPSGLRIRVVARSAEGVGWLSVRAPSLPRLLKRWRAGTLSSAPVSARGRLTGLPVSALGLSLRGRPVEGTASLALRSGGTLAAPVGRLRLAADGLTTGPASRLQLRGTLMVEKRKLRGRLTLSRGGQTLLSGRLALGLSPRGLFEPGAAPHAPLHLVAELSRVPLRTLRLGAVGAPGPEGPLHATLQGTLEVSGTLAQPRGHLEARLNRLSVGPVAPASAALSANYAADGLRFTVHGRSPRGGTLLLEGASRVDLSYASVRAGLHPGRVPARIRLELHHFDPGFLAELVPRVSQVGGTLEGSGWFRGTAFEPHIGGRLEWRDGTLALEGLGAYREIRLALSGRGDTLRLEDLTLHAVNGAARLVARVRLGTPARVDGTAALESFPLVVGYLRRGDLTARASFDGTYRERRLRLRIRVPSAARFHFPPKPPDGVIALNPPSGIVQVDSAQALNEAPPKPPLTEPPHAPRAPLVVDATLELPKGVVLSGDGPNGHVSLSPGFEVRYAGELLAFGVARVDRGSVPLLGQRLDVLQGARLRFAGPIRAGYLEISSERANREGGERRVAAGRAEPRGISVRPFGPGALNEIELYRLLSSGHLSLSAQSRRGKRPSFVGTGGSGLVEELLGAKVPLDLLGIEAGPAELSTSALQASTHLSDQLLLTYTSRIDAEPSQGENRSSVSLEYQLGPCWMIELREGDAEVGDANLVWRHRY